MLVKVTDDISREELIEKLNAQNLLIQELLAEKEAETKLDYPLERKFRALVLECSV